MEERFKYIHFKSEFFYNLLILNPSNYIKLIKIQITVNVSSKRRLGQDPTKLLNFTKCWVCNPTYILLNYHIIKSKRSLHPHQPREWLRHTPYLRTAQTLKPTCRVCTVRTHAFFAPFTYYV